MKIRLIFSKVFGTSYPSLQPLQYIIDLEENIKYELYKASGFNEFDDMVHMYVLIVDGKCFMVFYNLVEYQVFIERFKRLSIADAK